MEPQGIVTLQVILPNRETIEVEAGPNETTSALKERVAEITGFSLNAFTLSHEGDEMLPEKLVGEFPFVDYGVLELSLDKKQDALRRLTELGCDTVTLSGILWGLHNTTDDEKCSVVLGAMLDAGLYTDESRLTTSLVSTLCSKGLHLSLEVVLARISVDVNAKAGFRSEVPLHVAANEEIAMLLLAHGADVHARNSYGATPLHTAAYTARVDVASVLLSSGAGVAEQDHRGGTPLHLATSVAVATLLLKHNADVNARNEKNETPLHSMLKCGCQYSVLCYLLSSGADVNAKDSRGFKPIDLVTSSQLADLLTQYTDRQIE